jgi:zinc protease
MLQERATARADDSWVAGAWTRFLDTGRRFAANREREERLRAMTLDELNATWRRHIDPARLSVSLAGDPAKGLR